MKVGGYVPIVFKSDKIETAQTKSVDVNFANIVKIIGQSAADSQVAAMASDNGASSAKMKNEKFTWDKEIDKDELEKEDLKEQLKRIKQVLSAISGDD